MNSSDSRGTLSTKGPIALLPFDVLWALSPFLLLHHINFGVAVSCMALLVYLSFVQRSFGVDGGGMRRRARGVILRPLTAVRGGGLAG